MSKALTSAFVEAVKPVPGRQVEHADAKVPGLALRVSPGGSKAWTLRYRTMEGAQRRLAIGRFPAVGLSKARELALQAIGAAASGNDLTEARKTDRAAEKARRLSTVAGLIEAYFDDAEQGRHRPNARAKRQSTMMLERDFYARLIKPRFGNLAVADLTRQDLQRLLDEVSVKSPASARHCRAIVRQAFNYGIRREIVIRNPAQFSDLPKPVERERVLTDDELEAVWRVASDPATLPGLSVAAGTGLALCLAMLTLQRGSEVCAIHARELDRAARTWTIPGARTKNHRTHVVPLSDAAVKTLDAAFVAAGNAGEWSGYAFPSPDGKRSREPITRHALTRGMSRIRGALGIHDVTPHDFRRTGATNITGERIGIPRFIVSQVLNQISDTGGAATVTRVYDRNAYLAEKRRALDAWAALLAEIVVGKARAANIVSISGAAR